MSISLEDDLLERIEDARGDVPRSVWVRHAVLAHCEDCESRSPMLRERHAEGAERRHRRGLRMQREDRPDGSSVSQPAPTYRCSVCNQRTIGGPCVKHPKHSEVIA
jgi:hypothetical protein